MVFAGLQMAAVSRSPQRMTFQAVQVDGEALIANKRRMQRFPFLERCESHSRQVPLPGN